MAPALRLGFQVRVTEVRVTSVTSGLDGALGIRFGSVGLFGWTGIPNSEGRTDRRKEREGMEFIAISKQWIFNITTGICRFLSQRKKTINMDPRPQYWAYREPLSRLSMRPLRWVWRRCRCRCRCHQAGGGKVGGYLVKCKSCATVS